LRRVAFGLMHCYLVPLGAFLFLVPRGAYSFLVPLGPSFGFVRVASRCLWFGALLFGSSGALFLPGSSGGLLLPDSSGGFCIFGSPGGLFFFWFRLCSHLAWFEKKKEKQKKIASRCVWSHAFLMVGSGFGPFIALYIVSLSQAVVRTEDRASSSRSYVVPPFSHKLCSLWVALGDMCHRGIGASGEIVPSWDRCLWGNSPIAGSVPLGNMCYWGMEDSRPTPQSLRLILYGFSARPIVRVFPRMNVRSCTRFYESPCLESGKISAFGGSWPFGAQCRRGQNIIGLFWRWGVIVALGGCDASR
jgi:hypothetical protein